MREYKTIPFDIELAKKIVLGEVEGQFVTIDGSKAYLTKFLPAKYYNGLAGFIYQSLNNEYIITQWTKDGRYYDDESCGDDLLIEIPEDKPKEYHFEPFEKVVYKRKDYKDIWAGDIISYIDGNTICLLGSRVWGKIEILPYTPDTAKLIGTSDDWHGNADGTLDQIQG